MLIYLKHFKKPFLLKLALITFSLIGCAGAIQDYIAGSYQAYSGPSQPNDKIAFVKGKPIVYFERIDGKAAPDIIEQKELAEFLPGKHVLCIGFMKFGSLMERSTECVNFEINVVPGHVYQLYSVNYTHIYKWHPAIWDITNELAAPEHRDTLSVFNMTLQKTGREPVPAMSNTTEEGMHTLPGFGEKIKNTFPGKGGKQVSAEYKFYRYSPHVLVEADDGLTYHVQLSQKDGTVVKVLGTRVSPGKRYAFQPIDSDFAYTYYGSWDIGWMPTNDTFTVHQETSPGKYRLIKQAYTVPFNNVNYTALLDLSTVEGLNKDARRAMVLAVNADVNELMNNKEVMKMLRQRYPSNSKEFEKGIKKHALELAQKAVLTAEQLVTAYPVNSPEYPKAQSILAFVKQKLKR